MLFSGIYIISTQISLLFFSGGPCAGGGIRRPPPGHGSCGGPAEEVHAFLTTIDRVHTGCGPSPERSSYAILLFTAKKKKKKVKKKDALACLARFGRVFFRLWTHTSWLVLEPGGVLLVVYYIPALVSSVWI